MACELVTQATGGAPLSTDDYDAQNNYIQAAINKLMSDQLHLTQWSTLTVPKIRLGVYIQHGGALFVVNDANEDITDPGGLASGRIYIKATRTGDVLTFEFVDSAAGYSWNFIYCGFYHADGTQLLPYILYLTGIGNWLKYPIIGKRIELSTSITILSPDRFIGIKDITDGYRVDGATENNVFDYLDEYIPNTDDGMCITASIYATVAAKMYICGYVFRVDANNIRFTGMNITDHVVALITMTNGGATTYNVAITW